MSDEETKMSEVKVVKALIEEAGMNINCMFVDEKRRFVNAIHVAIIAQRWDMARLLIQGVQV